MTETVRKRRRFNTFKWLEGSRRPPSEYEEVTTFYCTWGVPFGDDQDIPGVTATAQPFLMNPDVTGIHGYMKPRTLWNSSAWEMFRDPCQIYYKVYNRMQWESEAAIDSIFGTFDQLKQADRLDGDYLERLGALWPPLRYAEWAVVRALQDVGHCAPSSPVSQCATFELFDGLRHVQRNITLTLRLGASEQATGYKKAWLEGEAWQPLREYVEHLMALSNGDWGETVVAANLALKPLLSEVVYGGLMTLAGQAGDVATPHLLAEIRRDQARHIEWSSALVRYLQEDSRHGATNAELSAEWLDRWRGRARAAVRTVAAAYLPEELVDEGEARADAALDERGIAGTTDGGVKEARQ